jgi:hypothetical protein
MRLEQLGFEGVDLMAPVQVALRGDDSDGSG